MSDTPNPMAAALRLGKPELRRRFYKRAGAGPHAGGFAVLLDGKAALTPGRKPLAVSDRRLAEALAAEWEAQGERIDPAAMALTRLVNTAIDRVSLNGDAVRAEIVRYASSDLLCYRADGPQSLVEAQAAAWDPLISWAREALAAGFVLVAGVTHQPQDPATIIAVERALTSLDPLQLAAVHAITTLTGSAILAVAVLKRRLSTGEAWAAAYVDEDWQMAHWGTDEIALSRQAARQLDLAAAGFLLGR